MIVKTQLLALTTSTLVAVGSGLIAPAAALAADTDLRTRDLDDQTRDLAARTREIDTQTREMATQKDIDTHDLESRLAEARARLEQAAHEVAELSSQMGGQWVDRFMIFNDESPSKAIIGVQLDAAGGKDGARIQAISPGGPADEAGLHVGDVITAINGTEVKGDDSVRQVLNQIRDVEPEAKVKVRVSRDGKSREFVVTARRNVMFFGLHKQFATALPAFPPGDGEPGIRTFGPVIIHAPLGDMELATLTPQLGRYFGTDKGVLVVRAPKDFKLEDGDVILAIDGREPTSGSHATRILASYQPGEKVTIKVMRQQKTVNLESTLPEHPAMMPPVLDGPERDRKTRMIPHRAGGATT
jgi:predicted metalloprotease with PDZ domain